MALTKIFNWGSNTTTVPQTKKETTPSKTGIPDYIKYSEKSNAASAFMQTEFKENYYTLKPTGKKDEFEFVKDVSRTNFEKALKFVFPAEGGFSNNPNDRGGKTNMGMTQKTYDAYLKQHNLPLKDVKFITKEEVKKIYFEEFWIRSGADKVSDPQMAIALFDTAILHGPGTAKSFHRKSGEDLKTFLDIRKKSYDEIVARNPRQKVFYKGWNNRVANLNNYLTTVC